MPTDERASDDALRASFAPRTDQTKALILDAMRALVADGQELSVTAIGRAAGVSRTTFYAHFGGMDGLAKAVWQGAHRAIDDVYRFDVHTTPDAVRLAYQHLVVHFAEHRDFYRVVATLPISKASHLTNVRAWADVIEESLHDQPGEAVLQAATIARYVAGAVYGLLDAWVTGDIDLTQDELVEHLVALHPYR
jgi:AcrR family transcriptional regulator